MKRYFVAILAVVALSGCGLEMGETLHEDGTVTVGDPLLMFATATAGAGGDAGTAMPAIPAPMPMFVPVALDPRGLPQDPVPMKGGTLVHRAWNGTPSDDP